MQDRAALRYRAFVTTKEEAFSAQLLFGQHHLLSGDLAPTSEEKDLIHIYGELGRPDLADSVRNGRKYGLLRLVLTTPIRQDIFNAACRALGSHPLPNNSTMEEIKASGLKLYKEDLKLQNLVNDTAGGKKVGHGIGGAMPLCSA